MIGRADITDKLTLDSNSISNSNGLNGIKSATKDNSPEALKAAAKQFEALLLNMMLKSMRQSESKDNPFENEQSRMFTSMLDQQLTQNVASKGMGLADALVRQLSGKASAQITDGDLSALKTSGGIRTKGIASYQNQQNTITTAAVNSGATNHVQQFQQKLMADAERASQATGIPAKFMLGQAALESGWGKKEIKAIDGTPSHNIFGIKANSQWKGATVEAVTTEFINGVEQRRVEKFKAYDSYADAFKDYANLLTKNPRYENVIANAKDAVGFAQGLQKAGYATDPQYANKLIRIITKTLAI